MDFFDIKMISDIRPPCLDRIVPQEFVYRYGVIHGISCHILEYTGHEEISSERTILMTRRFVENALSIPLFSLYRISYQTRRDMIRHMIPFIVPAQSQAFLLPLILR